MYEMMSVEIPVDCGSTLLIHTQYKLFKTALELHCKNWTSFGVESDFLVHTKIVSARSGKMECGSWRGSSRSNTRTQSPHCSHTHSSILKSGLACEQMRKCSQIFPSFLSVIPLDLPLRAEFARSSSPGGHTHAPTHMPTHTHVQF